MKTTYDTNGSNLSDNEVRALGAFKHGDPVLADRVSEALTGGQMRALHPQQITIRADMSRRTRIGGERNARTQQASDRR